MALTKYNYWCEHCTCNASNNGRTFQIQKDDSEREVPEYCLNGSHDQLKLMGESPYGGFAKFQSMTPLQRQEVLKKRSHEHFVKEIKERQQHMIKHDNG